MRAGKWKENKRSYLSNWMVLCDAKSSPFAFSRLYIKRKRPSALHQHTQTNTYSPESLLVPSPSRKLKRDLGPSHVISWYSFFIFHVSQIRSTGWVSMVRMGCDRREWAQMVLSCMWTRAWSSLCSPSVCHALCLNSHIWFITLSDQRSKAKLPILTFFGMFGRLHSCESMNFRHSQQFSVECETIKNFPQNGLYPRIIKVSDGQLDKVSDVHFERRFR